MMIHPMMVHHLDYTIIFFINKIYNRFIISNVYFFYIKFVYDMLCYSVSFFYIFFGEVLRLSIEIYKSLDCILRINYCTKE